MTTSILARKLHDGKNGFDKRSGYDSLTLH